ncbi:acyl-ACP--UDP-N-acetylglucosamine O-acyltransferase [Acidithiobacillus ferrooxidans F221]|uniref:acyl-ACP--UDP-N-acetylglucosamine O-acyltransferase n=1 Tax=Acidithiobacillus ferrooxidans TaxID=920 RepID=UPI001C074250|nr:acyl-ACP--UDP-N-acetylglucosamine O-acyltransferase [Acidithiobacillus ferrooxidans]MBU2807349.1 acyl-ACP--UDP-N-acetylglucosamine O-acyltransferase [Acidithiobacillus ferrooxidans F221]
MTQIHSTAIVDETASIGKGCIIGAYACIGPNVELGEFNIIGQYVDISGPTKIGKYNKIRSFAAVGGDPQDRSYNGEITHLTIGNNNLICEFVTMSRGTIKGGGITRIGDNNMFMAYSHVGHDCMIGNNVTFVNSANIAGHVQVQDYAFVGGLVAVHQHVRIGSFSIIGLNTSVAMDVPPYTMAAGNRASLHGINIIGLTRNGFSAEKIRILRRSYPILFKKAGSLQSCIGRLQAMNISSSEIDYMINFLQNSKRGYLRHHK